MDHIRRPEFKKARNVKHLVKNRPHVGKASQPLKPFRKTGVDGKKYDFVSFVPEVLEQALRLNSLAPQDIKTGCDHRDSWIGHLPSRQGRLLLAIVFEKRFHVLR